MPEVKHNHENNFNAIRLLAAAQVLIVHIAHHFQLESTIFDIIELFPGVPIFFFISGYLISRSYISLRAPVMRQFFWRRALRIFPALWVAVLIGATLPLVTGYLRLDALYSYEFWLWVFSQATVVQFYNPNFLRSFGVGVMNGALWTISVELMFYVLTPLIGLLFKRKLSAVLIIFCLSISINIYAHYVLDVDGFLSKLIRVTVAPWIYMFIIGYALSYFRYIKDFALSVPTIPLLLCYFITMFFIGAPELNRTNAINPISAVLLILCVLKLGENKRVYSIIGRSKFWENDFSYGLYIYHMLVINLVLATGITSTPIKLFVTVFGSIFLSVCSWFLIERHALKLKYRVQPVL